MQRAAGENWGTARAAVKRHFRERCGLSALAAIQSQVDYHAGRREHGLTGQVLINDVRRRPDRGDAAL